MTRRLISIVGGIISLLILAFIVASTYDNHLHEQEDLRLPNRISSYSDIGYYKIDPETILASLESGNTNVFIQPRLTNMQGLEEIPGISSIGQRQIF